MKQQKAPTVEVQMKIRKPVSEVFRAFIDPEITTKFWFTKSSGNLEVGKTVTWEWEMYAVSTQVLTKEMIPDQRILTEWGNPATTVEYTFQSLSDGSTYLVIRNYGYDLEGEALLAAIQDNTGGFTTVVDGLKAYLEHGICLNLIGDKFPKEVTNHGN